MRNDLFLEGKDISGRTYRDEFLQKQLELIAEAAETPDIKALSYSGFKTFYVTGSRKEYENEYFSRRKLLSASAVLALVNKDDKEHIKLLEDVIWAVADEFTWALPAHIPKGTDIEACEKWIDLFAAETAFAFAEILYLLEDRLDSMIKERIRYEVRRRVIDPYLNGVKNSWDTLENNWAAVCAGSVGAAFLYIADEEEIKRALPRLKATLRCYLNSFGQDGACVEGLNYWIYGFGYFTYFAQLLLRYTDGAEDLFDDPKVRAIALFPQKIRFRNNRTVTFSDSGDRFINRSGLMNFLSRKYSGVQIPDDSSALGFNDDECYRFAHIIRDFAWRDPEISVCGADDTGFEYLKNAAWYIKKTHYYEFAAKAGDNNESHNHNDIASFLVNVDGEGAITDPGRGEYTAEYFGDGRYSCFAPSSLAHSVPVINGGLQKAGAEHRGEIINADCDGLEIDFEKAYEDAGLKKLRRAFRFKENGFMMRDEIGFEQVPESITEHFVTCQEPVMCNGGLMIGGLKLLYDKSELRCRIGQKTFSSGYNSCKTVYMVDLDVIAPASDNIIEFSFETE